MQANLGLSMHNRFDVILTDAITGTIKQTAKAENLVCNTFLSKCAMGEMIIRTYSSNYAGMQSIILGTGTGTPAVTDSELFHYIVHYGGVPASPGWTAVRLSENTYSFTATVTADENTANGALTEIGLGESHAYSSGSYGWTTNGNVGIYTHALFTDSEGSPITINKTNADRLTITATIYGTVVPNNTGNSVYIFTNHRNINSSKVSCDPRIPYVQGDDIYTSTFQYSILGSIPSTVKQYTYGYPGTLPIYSARACLSLGETSSSKNLSTYTARGTIDNRIIASQQNYNYPTTILIKSLTCGGIAVLLPDESVYPAKQFTLTAVADGTTTGFNFGIPELTTSNIEVYIDNVLQPSNTYTFHGRDYTHVQGWKSFDTLYLDSFDYTAIRYSFTTSNSYVYLACPVYLDLTYYYNDVPSTSEIGVFVYDFKSEYTVSAVGKYLPAGLNANNPTVVPKLYYSNDKTSWTEVTGLWSTASDYKSSPNISDANPYIQISPITARYWKVENPAIKSSLTGYSGTKELSCSIVFGDPKPQLEFNTPPPANSTITLKAYCEYPIKNSNWIIEPGMTFDVTISQN